MNFKKQSCLLVTVMFFLSIISTSIFVQPASAAAIDSIANELASVYQYIDAADKPALQGARTELSNLAANPSDDQWDAIINPLMTDEVKDKFGGNEQNAKTAMIEFAVGVGNMYYSADSDTLKTDLTQFKNTYTPTFQLLFGTEISMEDLYQFLTAAQANLPDVISASDVNELAFGNNEVLITAMPIVFKKAISKTLEDTGHAQFSSKLTELGWNQDTLINQKTALSNVIDGSHAGELALAKAAVRSETALTAPAPGSPAGTVITTPIELLLGNKPAFTISILRKDATNLVNWVSDNNDVLKVGTDNGTGNATFEAVGVGTATVTAYRDFEGASAGADWIYRIPVSVTGQTVLYGDVNNDTEVDVWDALEILLYDAQAFGDVSDAATYIFANSPAIADINNDAAIDVWDALDILLYDAQMYNDVSDQAKIKLGL